MELKGCERCGWKELGKTDEYILTEAFTWPEERDCYDCTNEADITAADTCLTSDVIDHGYSFVLDERDVDPTVEEV